MTPEQAAELNIDIFHISELLRMKIWTFFKWYDSASITSPSLIHKPGYKLLHTPIPWPALPTALWKLKIKTKTKHNDLLPLWKMWSEGFLMSDKITLSFSYCFLKGKSIYMSWDIEDIISPMKKTFQRNCNFLSVSKSLLLCLSSPLFPNTRTFGSIHTQASLSLLMASYCFYPHTIIIPIFATNDFFVPLSFQLSLLILLSCLLTLSSHSLQIPHCPLLVSICTSLCPRHIWKSSDSCGVLCPTLPKLEKRGGDTLSQGLAMTSY